MTVGPDEATAGSIPGGTVSAEGSAPLYASLLRAWGWACYALLAQASPPGGLFFTGNVGIPVIGTMVVGRGGEDRGKKKSEGDAVRSDWHEWGATAVCDGACSPNPGGRMFWSVAVIDSSGDVIDSHRGEPPADYDGPRTSNVAEYMAATLAAKLLAGYDGPRRILTDSAVVRSGVRSRRSPTPHLQALLADLLQLLDAHRITVEWTPRALPVALLGH